MRKPAGWRPATSRDLPHILEIAARVHPYFPEDARVFDERLGLYPAGMHVLESVGATWGYMIAHPWHPDLIPALNSLLGHIPADADTFYLHDLALLPAARGAGAARTIVERMADHAKAAGLPSMSLVAVGGSAPFWGRLGFVVREVPALVDKLASYEPAARLMVRKLAGTP